MLGELLFHAYETLVSCAWNFLFLVLIIE